MDNDPILNPEDLTIRQPLFWGGAIVFVVGLVGGFWSDWNGGYPLSAVFDLVSVVIALGLVLLVRFKKVGMQAAMGTLLYLGAANFVFALVQNLELKPQTLESLVYKDLFVYGLFQGLAVFVVGRSAAVVFGGIMLLVLTLTVTWGASADMALDFWYEAPLVFGVSFLLFRYRSALDRLIRSQRQAIQENRVLRERERLAALGELTAGISHEIKNPLNLVVNFAESSSLLLADLESVLAHPNPGPKEREEKAFLLAELRQNMEDLRSQGLRGVSIVQSMLVHAREGGGEVQSLDLVELARETLPLAEMGQRHGAGKVSVAKRLVVPPHPVRIQGARGDLARALLNLCTNAFWSAAEWAQKGTGGAPPQVTVTVSTEGNEARIEVLDNGMGLEPQVKDQLFIPFFTTKPPGEGTGLGLSLTREVVQRHHGRIEVQGAPGQGARFTVILPLEEP